MPVEKGEFDRLHPCDFYTPEEILDPDLMYTVEEIARQLQDLEPDARLDPETEDVLIDWAIPWIIHFQENLVVGEPLDEAGPGFYGVKQSTE